MRGARIRAAILSVLALPGVPRHCGVARVLPVCVPMAPLFGGRLGHADVGAGDTWRPCAYMPPANGRFRHGRNDPATTAFPRCPEAYVGLGRCSPLPGIQAWAARGPPL